MAFQVLLLTVLLICTALAKPVVEAYDVNRPSFGYHHRRPFLGGFHRGTKEYTSGCETTSSTPASTISAGSSDPTSTSRASASSTLPTLTTVTAGGSSTDTLSSFSSRNISSNGVLASNTCTATVPAPTVTQPGIFSDCTKWYFAQAGDTCDAVAGMFGLSPDTFMAGNPSVEPPQCSRLLAGYAYCVAWCGVTSIPLSLPGTPTSSSFGPPLTLDPSDVYQTYLGDGSPSSGWPDISDWLSFKYLFDYNRRYMKASCVQFDVDVDTDQEIEDMRDAISLISGLTGIDERFILAMILQESAGCIRVWTTKYAHSNPRLMQSYNGTGTCNSNVAEGGAITIPGVITTPCPEDTIRQMVLDGTNGTVWGDGLVQDLQAQGDPGPQGYYRAAKIYNGGPTELSGVLEDGCCTESYVSDVANRLTGWAWGAWTFSA